MNYFWIPPGGEIQPGESPATAAARETFEETGYQIEVYENIHVQKSHPFFWEGEEYFSTTDYFFAKLKSNTPDEKQMDQREPYIIEHTWFPIAQGIGTLTVHPDIRSAAIEILTQAKDNDCI